MRFLYRPNPSGTKKKGVPWFSTCAETESGIAVAAVPFFCEGGGTMNFIGGLIGVVIGAVASVALWIADVRRNKR